MNSRLGSFDSILWCGHSTTKRINDAADWLL